MLGTTIKWSFLGCLVLLPVSCWQADTLPDAIDAVAELTEDPEQVTARLAPFHVEQGGVRYRVEPQYRYRLNGLVVSRRTHDGNYMLHRRWNDHLNVADVCVVWGENAQTDLSAFDFWSGQFTCFFETRDEAAWQRFRPDQLSNNHLLSNDAYLRQRLSSLEVGDQIRLEGYLASYGNDSGFQRGTSISRTDSGNGACETVYVTDFALLRPSPSPWPVLQSFAGYGLIGSLLAWVVAALKGWL